MPAGPRQLLQERFAQISTDLEGLFDAAREQTRRDFAEQLNQAVRRLRKSSDEEDVCATLADASSRFASGALLFRIDDGTARNTRIDVELQDAPALKAAVDGTEPVVALASAGEVSSALVELLGHDAATRAHIFPVSVRGSVTSIVYAWGTVQGAAIELLTHVAAAVWTAFPEAEPEPEPVVEPEAAPVAGGLIQIAGAAVAAPAPVGKPSNSWDDLPAAEQQVHLRAQRFARVQVAEMRLNHAEAVQSGRTRRDLYGALQQPIDAARGAFRAQFFACPSMVDYLDLELTRTLANENPDLLGQSYPGPLV